MLHHFENQYRQKLKIDEAEKIDSVFFYLQFLTMTIAVFSTNDRHQTRLWTLHGKGINRTSPSK